MGDKINQLDKVFQKTLANHSVNPDPEVWDRLSEKLEKKEKAVVFIWWKWASAAAVIIISFWLMYLPQEQELKNIASKSPAEVKTIEQTPFDPPIVQSKTESEEKIKALPKVAQGSSTEKINNTRANQAFKTKAAGESIVPKEGMLTINRTPEILPQALTNVNLGLDNTLIKSEIVEKPDLPASIALVEVGESNYKDYKVKIISNGYAIQPEKEKLVETLENKIGGLISKLDEEFGDLQDAKNNLFASLTTKRDKKNN